MQGNSINLDKVYIVESLFEGDYNTTTDIIDSILYSRDKPDWFEVSEFSVENRKDLHDFFSKIKEEIKKTQKFPIVHLELHGHRNENSVVLRNGDEVDWEYLVHEFEDINYLCGLNLVVFLGACFGINILKAVVPSKRAPFYGLLAPNDEVGYYDLTVTYKTFYESLFNTRNFSTAIDKLEALNNENIGYISAGAYYKLFIEGYFEKAKTPENKSRRIRKMVQETMEENEFNFLDKDRLTILYSLKTDEIEYKFFEKMYNDFFMIETFPDNKDRFPISITHKNRINGRHGSGFD